ncbi:MAG: single-stranded DNA-binding protein [Actinomycetota bacterium]|nr:single-stranded DNA-binding protein [Actinomycetota bacterium]
MNSVNLIGYLTADPEARSTPGGTSVTKMRVAVQRPKGKDGEDRGADFVDITAWGRLAEVCGEYLAKGRRVGIVGRLTHSEWDTDDGHRQKLEVTAENVDFLGAPRNDSGEPNGSSTPEAVEAAA